MIGDTHRARHRRLLRAVDELVADYLRHHRDQVPATVTVERLLDWAETEAAHPTASDELNHHEGTLKP